MVQKLKDMLLLVQWKHVLLLVGAGAAYLFFMQDNTDLEQKEESIRAESATIESLKRKITEAEAFEKQLKEKREKYASLVASLQKMKDALPRQFFLPDLLSDLLREAKKLEVEITLIRPDSEEKAGELYNSLGFNIEAKGTFLQFFIFLDRLANMQRLVHVESFDFTRDSSRPSVTLGGEEGAFAESHYTGGRAIYPGINGNIRVVTFRYRAPSTTPAVPAAGPGGKMPAIDAGKAKK
jgi:Tfp pilus assembly protein PilO